MATYPEDHCVLFEVIAHIDLSQGRTVCSKDCTSDKQHAQSSAGENSLQNYIYIFFR